MIGKNVIVNCSNKLLNGKKGVVTSIGSGVIPIHVTLEGERFETDFAKKELRVVE